ncbi:unnamed protein product [Ranitomeya imitator]|uniref:HTH cro/C1-type domain-containing protein n=1 Tax=Ranitomeya imitator TaxID=111125 RepID=A0ABN9LLV4_9NEOB|nr:unnamed protein product [Ranitomeya imitator]
MNTEATNESNTTQTAGSRLRNAREQLGLSQQVVAERLCLKVSTVRDIEEDKAPPELASTFLRGYIRSYARLVRIPEDELLPIMEKFAPVRAAKIEPMQSFARVKRRKKRDGWLMSFTWLILIVVLGLTGVWWWQNHQAQQDEISTMAEQSSVDMPSEGHTQAIPLGNDALAQDVASNATNDASVDANAQAATSVDSSTLPQDAAQNVTQPAATSSTATALPANTPSPTAGSPVTGLPTTGLPTAPADEAPNTNPNALAINFTDDCWLEVSDATGKKIFSGLQRKDSALNLNGKLPYKLKIGAPAAVQIQFQGKAVDLSRFISTNQVARLTLGAE